VLGVDLEAPGTIGDVATYEYDLQELKDDEKPWRKPGADITDYFNYGFTEETWIGYCLKQKRQRAENNMLKAAGVGGMPLLGGPVMGPGQQMQPQQPPMMGQPMHLNQPPPPVLTLGPNQMVPPGFPGQPPMGMHPAMQPGMPGPFNQVIDHYFL
jgi:pre-mRNA 3'-end-processing factor FIP1